MVVEGIERGEGKRSQRERTNRSRVDRFQKEATPVGEPKDNPIGEIGKSYELEQRGRNQYRSLKRESKRRKERTSSGMKPFRAKFQQLSSCIYRLEDELGIRRLGQASRKESTAPFVSIGSEGSSTLDVSLEGEGVDV